MTEVNLDPLLRKKKDKNGHQSEYTPKKAMKNNANKEKDFTLY